MLPVNVQIQLQPLSLSGYYLSQQRQPGQLLMGKSPLPGPLRVAQTVGKQQLSPFTATAFAANGQPLPLKGNLLPTAIASFTFHLVADESIPAIACLLSSQLIITAVPDDAVMPPVECFCPFCLGKPHPQACPGLLHLGIQGQPKVAGHPF